MKDALLQPQRISIVLATYNHPRWLEKVLWGYAAQTFRDFEVVIADDGSTAETAETIERVRAQTGLDIRHVWHEDDGFRKWKILNQAVLATTTDYLLFSDGDCIPRSDFVSQHVKNAKRGRFLCGGYYLLPLDASRAITVEDITSGRAFTWSFLRKHRVPISKRDLRVIAPAWIAPSLNRLTPTKVNFNGNNASVFKDDVLAAGGFDERMGHGGGDGEFGERLMNAGVRGKLIRFETLILHLDHSRGYANEEILRRNWEIRNITRREKRTRTESGLNAA